MSYVQQGLKKRETGKITFVNAPEKAGLGPKTNVEAQKAIKADRLKAQLFACQSAVYSL